MRGIRTAVSDLRKQIFTEVAKVACNDEANLNDAVEAIPYTYVREMFRATVKAFTVSVRSRQKK